MIKKWAERFFRWYCHPDFYEDIYGDLEELFLRKKDKVSSKRAEWYFAAQVLLLFRPAIIRPLPPLSSLNNIDMYKNYFKIGFRNLKKSPGFTLIHVLGLALGLTAFLYINHYTSFEKSYDRFHEKPEQFYRLSTSETDNGVIRTKDAMSFAPSGKILTETYPEITHYTTSYKPDPIVFKKGEEPIAEEHIIAADNNFLDLFNYKVIAGDKATLFSEPYTMVLTESQAQKYFGNANPIGQSIEVLGQFRRPFKITGIVEDIPLNTHYWFNTMVSLGSYQSRIERDAWNGYNYYTYVRLKENTDLAALDLKLKEEVSKHFDEQERVGFYLNPVTDVHLKSDFTFEPQIHGSARAVGFLSIISIFILLIAWINYVNLSTAKAIERAKEVGLRKVVGARKSQLIRQFFVEAFLINFCGALLALVLAQLAAPYFNSLVGKEVLGSLWQHPEFLAKLGLFFLFGTLITGFYPAIVLSSFRPIQVLKGSFVRSKHGTLMRKGLVVLQFTASLILVASTVTVYQQIRFMMNSDMGLNSEQVVGVPNPRPENADVEALISKHRAFTEAALKVPGVMGIGGTHNLPGGGSSDISSLGSGVRLQGKEHVKATIYASSMTDGYVEAMGLQVLDGRNFDQEIAGDTTALLVNEAFLKLVGINSAAEAVNQRLQFGISANNTFFTIVGVLKDFNRSTLKNEVEPSVYFYEDYTSMTAIKMNTANVESSIASLKDTWQRYFPDTPFLFTFVDERFAKLYAGDKQFGFIFLNFALLAIFVATIGLFGLSSFLALQRTKEVGVRKVLGASINQIVLLFFRDFLWLIIIAVLIGVPATYLGMDNWLSSYASRIGFPWLWLVLAIGGMMLLAFVTVSFQTWQLAKLNPAKTMRHD